MSEGMKWIEVEFGGRTLRVPALKSQGKLWIHWMGQTHVVESATGARKSPGERAGGKPGVITAPMPGKITKVAVSVGAPVQKGQTLIVMEAMKMEYTLTSDRDGKVAEIKATTGAQVGLGEVLVRVSEA